MKYKIYIFSFVIGIFFFVNNSYSDDLDQCYTDSPYKQCGSWVYYGFDMTYLGCTVHDDYMVRACTITDPNCNNGNTITRLETKIWQISWDQSCTYLQTVMFPGWPNNFSGINYTQWGVLFSQASSKMADAAFENFYNSLSPQEQAEHQCPGTPPNCGNPSWNDPCEADVYYSNFSCQYICSYFKDTQTGGQGPSVITMSHACVSENSTCCAHYVKYCKCGNETFKITSIVGDGLCEGAVPPAPEPPNESICFPIDGYTCYPSQGCVTICQ